MQILFILQRLPLARMLAVLGCGFLCACQNYSFSLNNRELYTPPALFSEFRVDDKALDTCIRQTIADQKIVKIEQLTGLNCSSAGIRSIAGLERFAWLEHLDLAGNDLTDGSALRQLTRLKYLTLAGNKNLHCAELPASGANLNVVMPDHCRAEIK
jgi:hypothetical protein